MNDINKVTQVVDFCKQNGISYEELKNIATTLHAAQLYQKTAPKAEV